MTCRKLSEYLPDMLFEPESLSESTKSHIAACAECHQELESLGATMKMLDEWKAPELSPFFDAKLSARLRAEKTAQPAGFLERLRSRLLFNSNFQLRPVAVTAFTVIIAIGGASYAGYFGVEHPNQGMASQSAAIKDLQSLDRNDQVFQQLNSVDQIDDGDTDSSAN